MTNKELREKIDRLETELAEVKEKVEALPNRVDGVGAFKPEYGEKYWFISSVGNTIESSGTDAYASKYRYAIGDCFPTRQSAEDAVRVLKLIQKAKESQGGFVPDWEDDAQTKYFLNFHMGDIGITDYYSVNTAPIFGFWEDELVCEQFVQDNYADLVWFFTEYRR